MPNNTAIIARLHVNRETLVEKLVTSTTNITLKSSDDILSDLLLIAENINELDEQIMDYALKSEPLKTRILRRIDTFFSTN